MPLEDPDDLHAQLLDAQAEVQATAQAVLAAIERRDDLVRRIDDISL